MSDDLGDAKVAGALAEGLMTLFFLGGAFTVGWFKMWMKTEVAPGPIGAIAIAAFNAFCFCLWLLGDHRARTRGTFGSMERSTWGIGCVVAYAVGAALIGFFLPM